MGLFALFFYYRRRHQKAGYESQDRVDDSHPGDMALAGLQEQNTSYARVGAHDLAPPPIIHDHYRNRESVGTMDPLISYGEGGDHNSRRSEPYGDGNDYNNRHSDPFGDGNSYNNRHSDDIANGRFN
jgi:hypothetical protein